ncbi:MAG: hypothetical protein K1X81_01565 [Bacteroidia bacterium]|nr:hypothetical protein [Bacteroidia bacterium]
MNKILYMLAAFLLLPYQNLHAQQNNLKIEWGPLENANDANKTALPYTSATRRIELIGADPFGYCLFRSCTVFPDQGITGCNDFFLMRYNYANKLLGQMELKTTEGKFLLCTKYIRGKLIIFTYDFKDGPNEGTVYAHTFTNMGKPLEHKQIARFYAGRQRFMEHLQISIPSDSNSFLLGGVSFDKNKTAHTVSYYLYDLNLKELFSTTGTLNFPKEKRAPELESLLLDSKGNIFSVVQLYLAIGEGYDDSYKTSAVVYLVKTSLRAPEVEFTSMLVAGKQIRSVSLLDDSLRGRLICAGVYEDESTLKKWPDKKKLGVYYLSYNKENGDILSRKSFDIPPSDLNTDKMVAMTEIGELYFREVFKSVSSNGSITIVAEEHVMTFNHLLCWNMNIDGELVWVSCVPKRFSITDNNVLIATKQMVSCLVFENDKKLYLIYRKRDKKLTEDELKYFQYSSPRIETPTALCIMDKKTGKFTLEPWPVNQNDDGSTFDGEQFISISRDKKIVHSNKPTKHKTGILYIPVD